MNRKYCAQTRDALEMIAGYKSIFPNKDDELWDLWFQLIDEGRKAFDRKNMRGHVTSSMMVLSPDLTETLLIYHLHHKIWLPPGGHIEQGKILDNAMREVAEETGVRETTPLVEYPIHIETHPITARPSKNEGEHWHHDMLFVGIAAHKETIHQESEVGEARWVSLDEVSKGSGHAAKGAKNVLQLLAQKAGQRE